MSESAHPRPGANWLRAYRASVSWQSSLSLKRGIEEIARWRNIFLSAIWFSSAIAAVVAALFIAIELLAPDLLRFLPGGAPPAKFAFAAAIYVYVIVTGSRNLLEGLGLTGREIEMIEQAESRIDRFKKSTIHSFTEVFGPNNPFIPEGFAKLNVNDQTATFKLIDAIRCDGERGRFDPINLMVERVADQVLGGTSGIRHSQQLGVRLGILGTFIGILLSLNGVGGVVGGGGVTQESIQDAIRAVVASLGVAFATSIAGLLSATLLQIMAGSLQRRESDVLERLHRLAADVQGICRVAARDGDQHELEATLREHRETINGFIKDLNIGADRVTRAVEAVTSSMDKPLEAIRRQGADLDAALHRQSDAIAHLSAIATTMRELEDAMAATQRQGMERFATVVEALTERLVAEIRTGYGRDAREGFEALIDRGADRQYQAVTAMARDFRWAMIFAGLALAIVLATVGGGFGFVTHLLTGR
jgi:methyl-accepting chemotaxis protein